MIDITKWTGGLSLPACPCVVLGVALLKFRRIVIGQDFKTGTIVTTATAQQAPARAHVH